MGFCYKTASIWQLIGYAFLVLKIVVPLIIIILGIVSLSQAIISNDEKQINKMAISLIKKIVLGAFIFFIPLIVSAMFSLLGLFIDFKSDFLNCLNCITAPRRKCDTTYNGNVIPLVGGENYNVPDPVEEVPVVPESVNEGTIILGDKVSFAGEGLSYQENEKTLNITKGGNYRFRGHNENIKINIDTDEDVSLVLRGVYMASEGVLINNNRTNKLILNLEENSNNTLIANNNFIISTNGEVLINGSGNLNVNNSFDNGIFTNGKVTFENGNIIFNLKDTEGKQNYTIKGGNIAVWAPNINNLSNETSQFTIIMTIPSNIPIGDTITLVNTSGEKVMTINTQNINNMQINSKLLLSSSLVKPGEYNLIKNTNGVEEKIIINGQDKFVINNLISYVN